MRAKRRRPGGWRAPWSRRKDCREDLSPTALSHIPQVIKATLTGSRRCTALGGLFTVDAYAPVLTLRRLLSRAGIAGDRVLEVWRGPVPILCFRVSLAVAARLEVRDLSTGTPVFVPWRERIARPACGVAKNAPALAGQPPGEK